jgi:hypothetical protein
VRVSHQRVQISTESVRARIKYHNETHFGCNVIILQGENVTLAARSLCQRCCAILSRLSTLVNTMKLIARRYNALNALNTELATQKHSFDIG